MYNGIQQFSYKGIPYKVEVTDAAAFPQDYAAAMTVYQRIAEFNKVITVDIGGFTLDYLLCIQVLFHMGLLKENEELKWAEKMDVH